MAVCSLVGRQFADQRCADSHESIREDRLTQKTYFYRFLPDSRGSRLCSTKVRFAFRFAAIRVLCCQHNIPPTWHYFLFFFLSLSLSSFLSLSLSRELSLSLSRAFSLSLSLSLEPSLSLQSFLSLSRTLSLSLFLTSISLSHPSLSHTSISLSHIHLSLSHPSLSLSLSHPSLSHIHLISLSLSLCLCLCLCLCLSLSLSHPPLSLIFLSLTPLSSHIYIYICQRVNLGPGNGQFYELIRGPVVTSKTHGSAERSTSRVNLVGGEELTRGPVKHG